MIILSVPARAQDSLSAKALEVTAVAVKALMERRPAAKIPKDQVVGNCVCARGSIVRLEDAQGRVLDEQTLTSEAFQFSRVLPGTYTIHVDDRITKVRLTKRDVRGGDAVDLKP